MKSIILASASSRRKELLEKLGLEFQVTTSNYEEVMDMKLKPLTLAKKLSAGKARAVSSDYSNHIVITADTFVALGDELLGKPRTKAKAVEMLKKISGKTIAVITGYTIIDTSKKKEISRAVKTRVYVKDLSDNEIANYVKTKEPLDKAGAFAIQGVGSVIIKKIEGDFYNVMGMPIFDLSETLREFGINVI